MRHKKPDLLVVLAIVLGLGIVTTSYASSLWERHNSSKEYQQALELSIR
ncbi:hypothetical protein [Thiopseudomonas alkaliphila]|nr:hypothetical protein [Thiopseudomonas alkaliphila]MDM1716405.1 hypothetical protein [Thiopseudomonas alkaliphila]